MKIQQLNEHVYIADQLSVDDITKLRDLGIQSIVNNRPDNEGDNQPLSKDLSTYAGSINIDYYYLPVISGDYPDNTVKEFTEIFNTARKPIVAFCRTGNRSIKLWSLSQVPKFGYQQVSTQAKAIGFDI